MDKVRLGLIGCGFMGQAVHLPCYSKNKACEIVALTDANADLGRKVTAKFQQATFYSNPQDLFRDNRIDAVALIVPPQLIADLAVAALESGKHVFAEKPIALRMEEGKQMVEASRRSGKILMAGYMKRYDLGTEYVKNFLADPQRRTRLGKITYARFHNFNGVFRGVLDPEHIPDETRRDYTAVGDLHIPDFIEPQDRNRYFCSFINFSHDINLMRHLLGDPHTVYSSHHRTGPTDYHTFSATTFEYDTFAAALETGAVECDYFDETVQIYFEKGWIELKFPQVLLQNVPAQVTVFDNQTGFSTPRLGWAWNFQRQADHFIECVRTGREPVSGVADSIIDIALGEAWYRSFLEKRAIKLT